jgi:hypothetical protein
VNPVKTLVFQEAQLTMAARRLNFTGANQPETFVRPSRPSCSSWLILCFVLMLLTAFSAPAQIQQAWVARYNNGITNGTNQAVKMALDASGNIYVTGFSQNANTNLGYVTIKYAPNGTELWAARYDSTNFPSATPAALVLDSSNDVIVTGSALTEKYDPNGNPLWTAPYAGTALAVDKSADIFVAGFSQDFGTVKLSPQGSSVWLTAFVESYGPTVSQSVLVDGSNNVYVSGLDSYTSFINNGILYGPYVTLTTIKYGPNGTQLWKASEAPYPEDVSVQVKGAALDSANNAYLVANFTGTFSVPYVTLKYATNGELSWVAGNPTANGGSQVLGIGLDSSGNAIITGGNAHYPGYGYGTYAFNGNGGYVWTNVYLSVGPNYGVATSITVDSANNSYVTGYTPGTNSLYDIATIKYNQSGDQVWLQLYTSLGNGNAAGNAIAVDNNSNVYVAGYDTTTAGGTEMVLIKYSPVTLQRKPDGTVVLETQGFPGESFDIQASADLLNWLDLGTVLADTNGLMQFDDTNATNYPARFYYTKPQ